MLTGIFGLLIVLLEKVLRISESKKNCALEPRKSLLGQGQTGTSEFICAGREVQDQSPLLHLARGICLLHPSFPSFLLQRGCGAPLAKPFEGHMDYQ